MPAPSSSVGVTLRGLMFVLLWFDFLVFYMNGAVAATSLPTCTYSALELDRELGGSSSRAGGFLEREAINESDLFGSFPIE